MKTMKRIAAFVLAISFCFVLMLSPGAHAQGAITGQQFGAWIGAGLTALNLWGQVITGSFPQGVTALQQLSDYYSAPYTTTYIQNTYSLDKPMTYTYDPGALSEALNTSTIRIRKGVTTIDGVVYDELWVSPEGAQKLKTNLFDFKTKLELLSNDQSTLAKGVGTINGLPLYDVNGTLRTQAYLQTFQNGTVNIGTQDQSVLTNIKGSSGTHTWKHNGVTKVSTSGPKSHLFPIKIWLQMNGEQYRVVSQYVNGGMGYSYTNSAPEIVSDPFDYDYVSGVIPAESEITEDMGLSIKIPQNDLSSFYETYPQYNFDGAKIDIKEDNVDINEMTQKIFDQLEDFSNVLSEFNYGQEPGPTPVDPIDNIDENVTDITSYQKNVNQNVTHMHQDVEAIHQTQQQQQQVQQQMQQIQQQQLQQQQQISQDTSSIKDSIENATKTPTSEELPDFKFDLRELFPFCIPFDIYRLLSSFDAEPQAPHVQIPVVIESIGFSYNLDLDFSAWNPVAQAMRTAELIVYAVALAWATGKVIKW